MTSFQDIESFSAYCHLVGECWDEIQQLSDLPEKVEHIVKGFVAKFRQQAASCTPKQAERWCRTLRTEPFAQHMQLEWSGLVASLRPRISKAIQKSNWITESEALEWIAVLKEIAVDCPNDSHLLGPVSKCLADVPKQALPPSVARTAFDVLERLTEISTKEVVRALRQLEDLSLPSGQDIWSLTSYRQAIWKCVQCVQGKEDRDAAIVKCLEEVLQQILADEKIFCRWTDVWCALEQADVKLEKT